DIARGAIGCSWSALLLAQVTAMVVEEEAAARNGIEVPAPRDVFSFARWPVSVATRCYSFSAPSFGSLGGELGCRDVFTVSPVVIHAVCRSPLCPSLRGARRPRRRSLAMECLKRGRAADRRSARHTCRGIHRTCALDRRRKRRTAPAHVDAEINGSAHQD